MLDDADDVTSLEAFGGAQTVWIGISDRVTEGVYLSVTGGAAPLLPWAAGEPNGGELHDCVFFNRNNGLIADDTCGQNDDAVCELDGRAADPSAY